MIAADSADAEVIDAFERGSATAADDSGTIAADEWIGDRGLTFGAVEIGFGAKVFFGHTC